MILVIKLLLNTTRFLLLLYSHTEYIVTVIYIFFFSTSVDLIWTYISIQLSYCYLATVHIIRIIKINN